MEYKNPMQSLRIGKVVINIGVGESGEKLIKAESLIQKLTGRKPIRTVSKHKIPTWNLRKGESIGCKVTLRGKSAEEFLQRGLAAKDNKLKESSFDNNGNIAFGIHEYIDLPGMKYDPDIGISGLNINTRLERPGFRISRRHIGSVDIPKNIKITQKESIQFFKEKFGVEIEQ